MRSSLVWDIREYQGGGARLTLSGCCRPSVLFAGRANKDGARGVETCRLDPMLPARVKALVSACADPKCLNPSIAVFKRIPAIQSSLPILQIGSVVDEKGFSEGAQVEETRGVAENATVPISHRAEPGRPALRFVRSGTTRCAVLNTLAFRFRNQGTAVANRKRALSLPIHWCCTKSSSQPCPRWNARARPILTRP